MLLLVLIVIVLALADRWLLIHFYSRWIKQGVFGDSAYHYCIIRSLCDGHRPYEGVPEFFLKNGPDRYPILFHRFASLFGLRVVERFPYLPNLLLFVGFASALLLLTFLLPGSNQPTWIDVLPSAWSSTSHVLGFLAVLLFITSVANNSLRGDSVLFLSLSERLLAKFSVGFYFLAVVLWRMDGNDLFLLVSIVMGCIAISTAMFSRQALLFTTVLWAVIGIDAAILLPLLGTLAVSVIIGGRNLLLSLRDQWGFSTSYSLYTAKSRVFSSSLSKFSALKRAGSIRAMLRQLINYEPGKSLLRHPDLILVLVVGWGHLPATFVALVWATMLIYLLTTTKLFRHFGESERYIDYNLAFILPFMIASEVISKSTGEGAGLIVMIALLYRFVLIAFSLRKDVGRSIDGNESLSKILEQAQIVKSSRVLPLPINFGQTISARAGCGVVCYPGVYGAWIFEKYIDEYPLLKRPLERLVNEFQITHIVLNKAQTEQYANIVGWSYDLSGYFKVAENEYWSCYYVR